MLNLFKKVRDFTHSNCEVRRLRRAFVFAFCILSLNAFCQEDPYLKLLGKINRIPALNGKVLKYNRDIYSHHSYSEFSRVFIQSSSAKVFSISNGSVKSILNLGDSWAIVIKGEDDHFYAFTDIDTVYISNNEKVKKGDLIGKSHFNKDENLFELEIIISDINGKYLSEDKLWEIIQKADSGTTPISINSSNTYSPICEVSGLRSIMRQVSDL